MSLANSLGPPTGFGTLYLFRASAMALAKLYVGDELGELDIHTLQCLLHYLERIEHEFADIVKAIIDGDNNKDTLAKIGKWVTLQADMIEEK